MPTVGDYKAKDYGMLGNLLGFNARENARVNLDSELGVGGYSLLDLNELSAQSDYDTLTQGAYVNFTPLKYFDLDDSSSESRSLLATLEDSFEADGNWSALETRIEDISDNIRKTPGTYVDLLGESHVGNEALKKAREAFKLGVKNPNTGKPYQSVKEAFDQYQLSLTDIESGSTREQISDRFKTFYRGTGGTEAEAEYDILKRQGRIGIKGTDFGKKDLSFKADREDIADNENFGPGDGFVDIGSGKVYILKPGGNKDDFTSNSYDIIDLKSLY